MENPFEIIIERLDRIEDLIKSQQNNPLSENVIKNVDQLSKYLNLSKSHIYKVTSSNEIPHSKRGKRLYFSKKEIDLWVLENRVTTRDEIEQMAANYLVKNKLTFL